MMRIRLHEKFDWKIPGKRAMQAFPIGDHTMTHEAGAEAIRQGKGKEIEKPAKSETDVKAATRALKEFEDKGGKSMEQLARELGHK